MAESDHQGLLLDLEFNLMRQIFVDTATVTLLALLCLAVPSEQVNKILAQEIAWRAERSSTAAQVLQTPFMRVIQVMGLRTERIAVLSPTQNNAWIPASLPGSPPPAELPRDLLANLSAQPLPRETDEHEKQSDASSSEIEPHAPASAPLRPVTHFVMKPKRTSVAEILVEQHSLPAPAPEEPVSTVTEVEPREVKRNRSVIIEAVERELDGSPLPPPKKTSAVKTPTPEIRQVAAYVEVQPISIKTPFEKSPPSIQRDATPWNRQAIANPSQHENQFSSPDRATTKLRSRSQSHSANSSPIAGPFGHGQ